MLWRKPSRPKCTCFICGDEFHLANKCPNQNFGSKDRINLIEDLSDDIVSLIDEDGPFDVYNICTEEDIPLNFSSLVCTTSWT